MVSRGVAEPVAQMQRHGDAAEEVAADPDGAAPRFERNVQQHGGQQAKYGKADRHDRAGDPATARAGSQGDERANVPQHGEHRGHNREPAPSFTRAAPVHQEEVQQHPEDHRAGAMADGIDQDRLVDT